MENTKKGKYVIKSSGGPKYMPRFTKCMILLEIYDNIEGITEPDIRKFLKMEFGIKDSKGIKKNHLAFLEEKGLIYKENKTPGGPNVWYPCTEILDYARFQKFWNLLQEDLRRAFFFTDFIQRYSQDVIRIEFIPHMKFMITGPDPSDNPFYDESMNVDKWVIPEDLMQFVKKSFALSPSLFSFCFDKDLWICGQFRMINNMDLYLWKKQARKNGICDNTDEYCKEFVKVVRNTHFNIEKNILTMCLVSLLVDEQFFLKNCGINSKNTYFSKFSDRWISDVEMFLNSDETLNMIDKYTGNSSEYLTDLLEIRKMTGFIDSLLLQGPGSMSYP